MRVLCGNIFLVKFVSDIHKKSRIPVKFLLHMMGISCLIYLVCGIWISLADDVIDDKCFDDGHDLCITLYESDNKTWHQAKDECRAAGKYLARIENEDIQDLVSKVLGDQNLTLSFRGWVAGRRSSNVTLQTLEGEILPDGLNITNLNQQDENCLTAIYSNGGVELQMENCDERDDNLTVVCSTSSEPGECTGQRKKIVNGECYVAVTRATEDDQKDLDWFQAQNRCKRQGGELVTYNSDSIFEAFPMIDQMWLGFSRKQWNWINQESESTMKYFNWKPGEGDSDENSPLCVNVIRNGRWLPTLCDDHMQYYLCANGSMSTMTMTTMRTELASTSTTHVTVETENPTSTDPNHPFMETSTHSHVDVITSATSLETENPISTDPNQPFTDSSTPNPADVSTSATNLETDSYPLTSSTLRVSTEEKANDGPCVAIYTGATIAVLQLLLVLL